MKSNRRKKYDKLMGVFDRFGKDLVETLNEIADLPREDAKWVMAKVEKSWPEFEQGIQNEL